MPELAEVEYYRKQWAEGLPHRIRAVKIIPRRVFRGTDTELLTQTLPGLRLTEALAHGKQMTFGFQKKAWLGVHLGMAGRLFQVDLPYAPEKHDYLVLETTRRALVFRDTRLFGRITFNPGAAPSGWDTLPPDLLSGAFDRAALDAFLQRRKNAPVKAILLMQERFPGIGNWMADEILWRAAIHPARPGASLTPRERGRLFKEIKAVCAGALETIGVDWRDPPEDWLFLHRWKDGGTCPRTKKPLVRETIGGRTTCFSPARQVL
jgi:formamidopyrimidine-DNA glycosylase